MRVIAGTHRGARIAAPKGLATRPTGDRVREAAFNLIGPVDGARVLDLFAGSGAMGIEALSRGAEAVTFVESDRSACRTIAENLERLRLTGARVTCGDALWELRRESRTYDLVLVDPPYEVWAELEPKLAEHLPKVLAPDGAARRRDRRAHGTVASASTAHLAAVRFRAAHPLRATHDGTDDSPPSAQASTTPSRWDTST